MNSPLSSVASLSDPPPFPRKSMTMPVALSAVWFCNQSAYVASGAAVVFVTRGSCFEVHIESRYVDDTDLGNALERG